jgi:serine/threonine protein kinase
MINDSYTKAADIWSFGALVHELFTLERLGGEKELMQYVEMISSEFKYVIPAKMPADLKNFIQCCLVVDPSQRANVDTLLKVTTRGKMVINFVSTHFCREVITRK